MPSAFSKPQLVLKVKRRVTRTWRVVLVGDRRAEQRHDAVAGVLVDGALEAVNAVGKDQEEAIEDLVPLLGVDLLGELHGPLHVGEQHRHLLALTFESGARGQDLLGEVFRRVGARVRSRPRRRGLR